jgi:hypothetical protein
MSEVQLEMQVPDNWLTDRENNSWSVKSPDGGSVAMAFVILENEDLEEAVNEAEKQINSAVGQLTLAGEATQGELNGLEYVEQHATAMDGQVSVSLTLILSPVQKWLLVAYFGAAEKEATWANDVGQIAASLKPVKNAGATDNKTNSFPMPFNKEKALALLFGPTNPDGDASWQPTVQTFASIAPVNGIAISRAIGFKSYDYDETIRQVFFLYKTSFPQSKQPLFSAVIGAALFNCENGLCTPVWNNPALVQYATYEDETNAKFVSIGQGQHGAIIESSDLHQGITTTNAILIAVYENEVVVAAKDLPVYEDNEGAAENPAQAYKYSTSIEFEPGAHPTYSNMKVKFSGTTLEEYEQGGRMISKVVPAKFTRSFFWDDNGFYEEEIECEGPADEDSADSNQTPEKLGKMLPVFDSVIRVIISGDAATNANNFTSKNTRLLWSILYHIAINHGNLHSLIKVDNNAMHVPVKTMQEFATACFADYEDLAAPPESFEAISYNQELDSYDLQLSDSGPSYCKILQVKDLGTERYAVSVGFYEEDGVNTAPAALYEFIVKPNSYAKFIAEPLFNYSIESYKKIK